MRVVFAKASPFWPGQYSQVMLIPKHRFSPFVGSKSRYAPHNNRPVGTGAYTFADFVPGDLLRAKANPNYHLPKRPHFDALELKVGGDNASTARGVLQSGEYDYAGGLLNVEDDVLRRMEQEAKGKVVFLRGSSTLGDLPEPCRPGRRDRRGALDPRSRHPVFSDVRVRRAIGLLIDRAQHR